MACILLLSACGTAAPKPTEAPAQKTAAATVPGLDPATGDWIGQGGSYRFTVEEDAPDFNSVLLRGGTLYGLTSEYSARPVYTFLGGGETLYTLADEHLNLELIGQSAEGFWFHTQRFDGGWQNRSELLELLSPAGELLKELDVTACVPEGERGFLFGFGVYEDQPWVTTSEAELLLLDGEGAVRERAALPEPFARPSLGGDGLLYLTADDGQTQTLSRLENGAFTEVFTCPMGPLFPGDENAPFLLSRSDGLYAVDAQGATQPIVIYEECCLSLTGLSLALPLGDGRYYCRTAAAAGTLEPAEPEQLHPRTRLTFGYLSGGAEWFAPNQDEIAGFNLMNPDYYIDMVDLSEGGALTDEQALSRLGTALTNGTAPDMLSLLSWQNGEISPFPFIRQGLLVDLAGLIEQDAELSLDDILIARALQNDAGGLYFLCSRVSIGSYFGDWARFGDRWGWTFDEYLEIDRTLSEGQMVFYNLTRDRFLQESASSFMRSAIDWNAGTCDFDNDRFLALLNAAKAMRETPEPEDPDDMIFWDPNHIFDGTQVVEVAAIMDVAAMASEQRMRGVDRLSFVGWPSPDGSCGSLFNLQSTFAILSTSEHIAGCWDFVKYGLKHTGDFGLPVYRPALEEKLKAAQTDVSAIQPGNYRFTEPLTEGEAAQFRELLGRIEHTSLCDKTVMDIIRQECEPFFRGEKTAEQTAALIQSRLSLYVAEQKG